MEKFRDTLAIIFYLIWIPLGLLLAGGVIVMIAMNPLEMMQDMFSSSMEGMGDFGAGRTGSYGPGDNMPSREMMDPYNSGDNMPSREMMDQDGPATGFEDFVPPDVNN